ncbi:MAG: glycosyltransferase [Nitrospirae bacterium]|nr:glycosyltransferase [Nitrospirota bacterium]
MRKLKILTFNWHEVYIHMLAKTGHDFDVVEVPKGGRFGWIREFRPVPKNCRLITEEEALAKLDRGWYDRFIAHNIRDISFIGARSIPKILVFHNKFTCENALGGNRQERAGYLSQCRQLLDIAGNPTLIFISEMKKDDWGFAGEVILPGIDPGEYGGYRGNEEKVLRIGNGLIERDIMLGYSIQERLLKGIPSTVLGLNYSIPQSIIPKDWEGLKEFMRSHRLYLNTTLYPYEDGYNLSMLEAMATGMPVVSIANPTSPIEDGINGFISDDEGYLRERIEELLRNPSLAMQIGQKARETVIEKFPIEKFISEWKRVLDDAKIMRPKTNERFFNPQSLTPNPRLKILMSYTSNPQTTAAYMEKALRMHHDIVTYGPRISEDAIKLWDLEKIKDRIKDHDIPFFTEDINKVFQGLPDGWSPDLFLWVETGVWFPVEGVESLPCLTACYLIDSHLNLEKHIELARMFDIVFIAQKAYLPEFKEAGIENVFWLPLGCDTEVHSRKAGGKLYDIGFIGSLNNPKRNELLNKLKEKFNIYYERCFLERMAEVFSQSKIVFNISAKNDLNMRVFEALCSGSMLLTDEATGSGLTEFFQDKKHLAIYSNETELFKLAEYYLSHAEEREKIAQEGMKEALNKHTYEHRAKEMIEIISSLPVARRCLDTHPEAVVLQPYCIGKGIDVGCGFRKTHPDAIGVDLLAKGEAGEHGCVKGMKSQADIKASGDNLYMFKDGELDYVVSRHNLEHYVDPLKTLLEWKRVLKTDGILAMVLPDESRINTIALDPTHKSSFTPSSIKRLLDMIGGFEIIKIEPVVENWSFAVIAKKTDRKNIIPGGRVVFIDSDSADYYKQERRDVQAMIPNGTIRVLDIGCGEGVFGKRLLEKGAQEVTGIEVTPDAAKKAGKNLSRVVCADIETIDRLPFENGYFDCLILSDVLEHLKDPLSVLTRLKDYLSEDGVIIASIPNVRYHGVVNMLAEGYWRYQNFGILDRTHLRFFTKKEMEKLFQDAGFDITGLSENIDPAYHTLKDPLSGEIEFGRVTLKGLSPEEMKDLFVVQYLIRAKKAEVKSYIDSENSEERLRRIEDYLQIHPADLDALMEYAGLCYKNGLLDNAIESLERVLIFDSENKAAMDLKKRIGEGVDAYKHV